MIWVGGVSQQQYPLAIYTVGEHLRDTGAERGVCSYLTLAQKCSGKGRILSRPNGYVVLLCVCVSVRVCARWSLSASGATVFHLVNIIQPAPPLHCHHHHNWQLAGYMLLQLSSFGPKREKTRRERERERIKHRSVFEKGRKTKGIVQRAQQKVQEFVELYCSVDKLNEKEGN